MRAFFAAALLVTLGVVPAADFVACPDGCTDSAHQPSVHQSNITGPRGGCNLCVNTIALDRIEPPIERLVRLAPVGPSSPHDILSAPPPLVERPPRRS